MQPHKVLCKLDEMFLQRRKSLSTDSIRFPICLYERPNMPGSFESAELIERVCCALTLIEVACQRGTGCLDRHIYGPELCAI